MSKKDEIEKLKGKIVRNTIAIIIAKCNYDKIRLKTYKNPNIFSKIKIR
jgi:hypothetical protein